jgi:F-type H+-transporting ATPase subunit delta
VDSWLDWIRLVLKKLPKNWRRFLVDQRLHSQVEDILVDISKEYAQVHGIIDAEARTAFPLSDDLKNRADSERVKQSTGAKTVILHEEIDRNLLGGVIVSAPDMELDLSLKTKLVKLRA